MAGSSPADGVPDEVRDLIVAWLIRPVDFTERDAAAAAAGTAGPVAYSPKHQAEGADPASILFVKHRSLDDHHVLAVTWTDGEGRAKEGVFSVAPPPAGGPLRIRGSHFGGVGGDLQPKRAWLNAGGGSSPFYAGGRVLGDPSVTLARVLLQGASFEDSVGPDGWAVFPTGREVELSEPPQVVELFDASAVLVNRHRLFRSSKPI